MKLLDNISNFMRKPIPKLIITTEQCYEDNIKYYKESSARISKIDQEMLAYEFAQLLGELNSMAYDIIKINSYIKNPLIYPLSYAIDYVRAYEAMEMNIDNIEKCNSTSAKDIRKYSNWLMQHLAGIGFQLKDGYELCQKIVEGKIELQKEEVTENEKQENE